MNIFYMYTYIFMNAQLPLRPSSFVNVHQKRRCGVATISRLLKIIDLFCKRAL